MKENILIFLIQMRFHLIVSHSKFDAKVLSQKCDDILKFEGVHTIIKNICAKTILNGETITL